MKTNTMNRYSYYACHRGTPDRYPNCASMRDIRNKIVDTLLAAAITVAVVAVVLFLLVL